MVLVEDRLLYPVPDMPIFWPNFLSHLRPKFPLIYQTRSYYVCVHMQTNANDISIITSYLEQLWLEYAIQMGGTEMPATYPYGPSPNEQRVKEGYLGSY